MDSVRRSNGIGKKVFAKFWCGLGGSPSLPYNDAPTPLIRRADTRHPSFLAAGHEG